MLFMIFAIIAVLIIGAALMFNYGPYILKWFVDKVDEWEDIVGCLHDEE